MAYGLCVKKMRPETHDERVEPTAHQAPVERQSTPEPVSHNERDEPQFGDLSFSADEKQHSHTDSFAEPEQEDHL